MPSHTAAPADAVDPARHRAAHLVDDGLQVGGAAVRQEQRELLAAVAGQQVASRSSPGHIAAISFSSRSPAWWPWVSL